MLRFKIKPLLAQREFSQGRKITLAELAEAAGTNRATLSRMVNQPGVVVRTDVIDALCRFFECSVADLVDYVPDGTMPGAAHRSRK